MNKIETILNNPNAPAWMKQAVLDALNREPITAVNEAQFLYEALRERADAAVAQSIYEEAEG